MTGSVLSAILLSEVIYWWDHQGKKPFYKFKQPAPSNIKYKKGDSWCEALGFTRSEFDRALSKIGARVKKGEPLPSDALVWFWTTIDRVTYYRINEDALISKINEFYVKQDPALRKAESSFTALDSLKLDPDLDKKTSSSYTTTTTTTGVVFPAVLKKHQSQINKLIKKIAKEDQQSFVDDLEKAVASGQIKKSIISYANGMIDLGYVPSESSQSSRRDSSINQRIADIQDATKDGALILINGKPASIDGRFAVLDDSTIPLGGLVASELDKKISIQIEGD